MKIYLLIAGILLSLLNGVLLVPATSAYTGPIAAIALVLSHEVARNLTSAAAEAAGFGKVVLLESSSGLLCMDSTSRQRLAQPGHSR